jgi:membrane protease YdiL (CAAX protease family)
MIGLFEELIFRGVLFSVIAGYFSDDKKGLWKTFIISSLIFGGAHLFNLLYGAGIGATLLQAVYTTLTGGLFAFAFIKTKNILIPAFLHAVYNFCGLLFSEQGLGLGAVLDFGTGVTMAIVGVVVGVFVLYALYKHPEKERKELYARLNVHHTTNA